ncbi:MAG: hypothetical protein KDD66_15540 [Bdellovibrionales bacterium]|nr:hypothetical protein [Bdellovibrionales bacterium]
MVHTSAELLNSIRKLLLASGYVIVTRDRQIGRGDAKQWLPGPPIGARRYFNAGSRTVVDVTPHTTATWNADTQTAGRVQPVSTVEFLRKLENP